MGDLTGSKVWHNIDPILLIQGQGQRWLTLQVTAKFVLISKSRSKLGHSRVIYRVRHKVTFTLILEVMG